MFSVVIATHNRAKTIEGSTWSVLNQTYKDLEVIVVDDGSTDNTEKVVREIEDKRLRYTKFSENQGASAARNKGIQEAKGDYIMVWDSDDILYENAIEKVVAIFEKNKEFSIVSAPARVLIGGVEQKFLKFPEGEAGLADILCKKLPSNEKIRVAKADLMKNVSYKSRNIDFLVNIELIEKGKWYHMGEFLGDVINNPNEGSLTASRKKRSARYSIERAQHLVDFVNRQKDNLKRSCKYRYADYCYGAAIGFLLDGKVEDAQHFSIEALKNHPLSLKKLGLITLCHTPFGNIALRLFY